LKPKCCTRFFYKQCLLTAHDSVLLKILVLSGLRLAKNYVLLLASYLHLT